METEPESLDPLVDFVADECPTSLHRHVWVGCRLARKPRASRCRRQEGD